nr:transmembrane protein 68-like [Zootoca vivipara]
MSSFFQIPYLGEYLTSVVHPLWLLMLLILLYSPMVGFFLFLWALSFLLHIYKKMNNQQESDSKFWEKPRKLVALASDIVGKICFGYEVIGIEHIPKGPGVIVYYHAATSTDYSLLVAKLFKETQRKCYSVIDHAIYQLPGLKIFFDTMGLKDFSKAECVEILKEGHFIGISPGGGREANFSNDYSLMWGKRTGFAQIALEAKVPIIPIFTQNICEAYRNIALSSRFS